MTSRASDEWKRALRCADSARLLLESGDADGAASRAYYAAFHAMTALFLLEEREFTKHSALHAAVHRDLIRAGRASPELGQSYSTLFDFRAVGDYGGDEHVNDADARIALAHMRLLLDVVQKLAGSRFD